jgi:hypothetical protein
VDYFGSAQAVVTSEASNDSGMFETNLRDERFLPFEGAGAVSTWSIALPAAYRPFDFMTISDLVLHVRYTARDGGAALAKLATGAVPTSSSTPPGPALLFSLRYDFPTEWAAFLTTKDSFQFQLRLDYFPYMVAATNAATVSRMVLYYTQNNNRKLVQKTLDLMKVTGMSVSNPPSVSVTNTNSPTVTLQATGADAELPADPPTQAFLVVSYQLPTIQGS